MATPAQATFNQSGLSGAFSKANANNQMYSVHQGDMEALRPRAQSTPDLTLQVQAATVQSFYRQVYYNNAQSTYAGGNSSALTAPVSNPRIDILYLTSGGSLAWITGTEAASPVPPTYPDLSQNYPICEVYCRVGMTAIVNFEDSGANPTKGYIYRDVRPFWATGGVSAHSGLTGLTAGDDHTQYAKLAGRAGGQTLQGGTAASNDLNLESTSHATKGRTVIKGGRAKFEDAVADPAADGEFFRNGANYKFHDGTAARTFVHSNTTAGGDLSGLYPNPTVAKLQTRALAATAPTDGQVVAWNNGGSTWEPQTPIGSWKFIETLTLTGTSVTSATLPTDSNVFLLVFDNARGAGECAMRFNGSITSYKTRKITTNTIADSGITDRIPLGYGGSENVVGTIVFDRLVMNTRIAVACQLTGYDNSVARTLDAWWAGSADATSVSFVDTLSTPLAGKVHIFKLIKQ